MKETGGPLHGAIVLIVELGRSTLSGDDGAYEFDRVPPGRYHLVTHLDSVFSEAAKTVEVRARRYGDRRLHAGLDRHA